MKFSEITSSAYIKRELEAIKAYKPVCKDILLVVKDQPECVKNCIESIFAHTNNFKLYIWDNGSREETANYLKEIDAYLHREDTNIGFIKPNNRLAALGNSPYMILLNSDTIVSDLWDVAMISWLQTHSKTKQVGYMGMKYVKCGQNNYDLQLSFDYDIDFVVGWCMCIPREIYCQIGLFDEENLKFAFSEDADLSLRLKEAGHELYALYLPLVEHIGNQTIETLIAEEGPTKFAETSMKNGDYIRQRYLHKK